MAIQSKCFIVTKASSLYHLRMGTIRVMTMANPANTAYGGKMVTFQPGTIPMAKSNDTMVCTESTSGVEIPARISEACS